MTRADKKLLDALADYDIYIFPCEHCGKEVEIRVLNNERKRGILTRRMLKTVCKQCAKAE